MTFLDWLNCNSEKNFIRYIAAKKETRSND